MSLAGLNTGIDWDVPMTGARPDMEGIAKEQSDTIIRLLDLAGRYAEIMMADPKKTLEALQSENIATALLFIRNSATGKLDTSSACGPRNVVGQALEDMTRDTMALAKVHLPWLKVNFYFSTKVIDINLENPRKPVLTVHSLNDDRRKTLEPYDLVFKSTGTTWAIPIKGEVAKKSYTGVPNSEALWDYLHGRQTVLKDGTIRPGTKILIGGASLSAFDPVGILLTKTGIVKFGTSSPDGYWIDEKRASQYPGLITFFNRPPGEFVRPRHTEVPSIIPEEASLFTPDMILSQQLHKFNDPFQVYIEKARLLNAVHFKKLPKDIEPHVSTPEQFAHMAEENKKFTESPDATTETGMMRAAAISFLIFSALGSNMPALGAKVAELEQRYPLLVRNAYDSVCSSRFSSTHRIEGSREESANHTAAHRFMMSFIASSPVPIYNLITRLYHLGVIGWEFGQYEQVAWSPEEQRFVLNDLRAHGLIAARILTADTDDISKRVLAQAKKQSPGEPIYSKGRFPRAKIW